MSEEKGEGSLQWGVINGDMECVKSLIDSKNDEVHKEFPGGRNALHLAADYGQTEVIEYLLSKGADINKPDKHGITPLLNAIYEGHTEAVKVLLNKGANKKGKAPDGSSYYECAETDDMKELLKE